MPRGEAIVSPAIVSSTGQLWYQIKFEETHEKEQQENHSDKGTCIHI